MTEPFVASFTGTAVEFFETVVIAYAIFRAGYPREAVSAVVAGHALVFSLAVFLFPVHEALPFWWLRLAAALLLSAMGIHWSVKSARRLLAHRRPRWMEDPLGKVNVAPVQTANAAFSPMVFLVMGKSSVVEAAEILLVVFPVAAATGARWEVVWGVAAGIAVVSIGAALLHGQLKKVPEVGLKLAVGLLLATLGLSWIVELLRDSV